MIIRPPGRALVNVLSIDKEGKRGDLPSFDTANIPLDFRSHNVSRSWQTSRKKGAEIKRRARRK
jgi:hypothetical protein